MKGEIKLCPVCGKDRESACQCASDRTSREASGEYYYDVATRLAPRDLIYAGDFSHGTGGGKRIIRSTKPLS